MNENIFVLNRFCIEHQKQMVMDYYDRISTLKFIFPYIKYNIEKV